VEFCAKWRDDYHFGSSPLLGFAALSPNGAVGGFSVVLGLDVRVEGGIGEVSELAGPADVLPALLILAGLANLLLFLVSFAFSFNIILDHVVVDHVHLLVGLSQTHHFVLVALADG
jgi:hypothetical protein